MEMISFSFCIFNKSIYLVSLNSHFATFEGIGRKTFPNIKSASRKYKKGVNKRAYL